MLHVVIGQNFYSKNTTHTHTHACTHTLTHTHAHTHTHTHAHTHAHRDTHTHTLSWIDAIRSNRELLKLLLLFKTAIINPRSYARSNEKKRTFNTY